MFWIPYGHIRLRTLYNPIEVEYRLADHVEPRRLIRSIFRRNHKFFEGHVENGHFKINRIINRKNSFVPVIVGNIEDDLNYTTLDMVMRLDYLVMGLLVTIVSGVVLSGLFASLGALFGSNSVEYGPYLPDGYALQGVLSPFACLILFYLLVMIPFNLEARKARLFLEALFA